MPCCQICLMCHSCLFSCRKTMVVHWSARNMSAKSSSVWAFKGQNAPHRSLHFLLTLRSTLSGYTKCSNFTPIWRGTDDVAWLDHSLRKEIPPSMNHREKWGKSLNGMWPFADFMPDFVILQRGHNLVIEDGINQTESILQFCKFGLLAWMSFLQPKFLAHGQHTNCILTCSEFLKPKKTIRMTLVTQYYLLEYTWIWTEPSSLGLPNKQLGFLFFFLICWARLQNRSIYHQHKCCGGIFLVFP